MPCHSWIRGLLESEVNVELILKIKQSLKKSPAFNFICFLLVSYSEFVVGG
jgi:hypothetical protein